MGNPQLLRQQYLGYKKEAVRNTAETSASVWLPVAEFDLQPQQDYFVDDSQFGRRESVFGKFLQHSHLAGKLKGYQDADYLGYWLSLAMGKVASVTALGATTHTFTVFNTDAGNVKSLSLPTASLFYSRGEEGKFIGKGINVDKLTLDYGENEATFEADIMGISEALDGGSPNPAYTTPSKYLMTRHVIAKSAATIAGLSAGTTEPIRNLKIAFTNNVKPDWSVNGTEFPYDYLAHEFSAEISFTQVVRLPDLRNYANNSTKRAWQFTMENAAAGVLGTSALFPKLTITVAPSQVAVTTGMSLNDEITVDVTLSDITFDTTAGYAIQAVLQSSIANL